MASAVTSSSSYSAFSKKGTASMERRAMTLYGCVPRMSSSMSSHGRGCPCRFLAYLARHAASPTKESRNMDCSSAYGTEVGARSWEKRGLGMSMLAKCAAWPASCIRVVRAVSPEPTAEGSARLVKWATLGCQDPSPRRQAGWGQWQKPLEYFLLRSRRSRSIVAPLYVMPKAEKLRPQFSTAFSNGKYGSSLEVVSPAMRYPVFQGSSAPAPFSLLSLARAASMRGRVSRSSSSKISNRVSLPNPSACVTL
mmetsp:Transcript_2766/g.5802  ORF Transcript_2766/g.5802 Transcript_2766/m.5802 type:complete len:252 (+) Transcript_2766:242-997(+)